MVVSKWMPLAGVLLFTTPSSPAVSAQDREPILRALEIAGNGVQIGAAVSESDTDDGKTPKAGVVVESVTPGGPADKAGVKAGDAITEFDGERVRSVRQFSRLVLESTPAHSIAATLSRNGQKVTVNITPERRTFEEFGTRMPRALRVPSSPAPPAPPRLMTPDGPYELPGIMRLWSARGIGITIESLDNQLAEYFGVKDGVLVKSVLPDSAAQKAGLKAGDVITAIDGRKIYETSDVSRAIDRIGTAGEFSVEIMRDKKPQTLKGKIESEARRSRTRTML